MIRIVLSRAALFPWLGLALLGTGAAFPEGSVAGLVLVVVGANVAFYSLRDFSRNFAWGADARPMLALCGLAFLLGLALVACAARFDALNRWLALLCAGLYLCLFAVWTAQQPVGWPYRALAFAGVLLMLLGGVFAHLGWWRWRVFAECEAAPQEIALDDLVKNGFGGNRYVRLKDFRFCDRHAAEKGDRNSKFHDLWFPLVAVNGPDVPKGGSAPPVPPRVTAVAAYLSAGGAGAAGLPPARRESLEARARRQKETDGYEGTVVTGLQALKLEVRQQLCELAPQTDFAEVVLLDWRRPGPANFVYGCLAGGGAGLLLGLLALGIVYARAWKAVGAEGWRPEEATEEGVPEGPSPAGA
jgi:hypothetical protein